MINVYFTIIHTQFLIDYNLIFSAFFYMVNGSLNPQQHQSAVSLDLIKRIVMASLREQANIATTTTISALDASKCREKADYHYQV
jgi:hypothetical protein